MSQLDLISDHSKEKLTDVPDQLLDMSNLKMLFLEGNYLTRLPDNFFYKLPRLMWLDLRNNLLESIPRSVANHRHLENLLLSNNNIRELPNELGLVPNLKALQVSENPLVYPVRRIIAEGTKAIRSYLKHEYERLMALSKETEKEDEDTFAEDEHVMSTVDIESCSETLPQEESNSTRKETKNEINAETNEITARVKKKQSEPILLKPPTQSSTLHVQQLPTLASCTLPAPASCPVSKKKNEEPLRFIHKVNRDGSRISLKSSFNRIGVRSSTNKMENKALKEGWLNQLRILLNDQERILQQERNLRALTEWRQTQKKRAAEAPKTFYDSGAAPATPVVPYATYPQYSKMPSRQELACQLDELLRERAVSKVPLGKGNRDVDMEKLISDLVQQIKEMESACASAGSPRTEMEQAGRQIKTITDIHKKLLRLKRSNDLSL